MKPAHIFGVLLVIFASIFTFNARGQAVNWTTDGIGYYEIVNGEIIKVTLPKSERNTIISRASLTPAEQYRSYRV